MTDRRVRWGSRRARWGPRLAARSTVALPAIQVGGAAIALMAWLAISASQSVAIQGPVIDGYAYGAIASLVATLGIPFLVPNLFRGIALESRLSAGPWSASLWVGSVVSLVCLAASVVWAVGWKGSDGGSLALAYAGGVSAGVMLMQVARITEKLGRACIGILPQISFPACWLVGFHFSGSVATAGGVTIAGQVGSWVLCQLFMRSNLGSIQSAHEHVARAAEVLRGGLLLLPHLLAFTLLGQGPRLAASLFGDARLLASAHAGMLIVGAGATLLASINALFAVKAQTVPDSHVPAISRRFAVRYAAIGLSLALGAWAAIEAGRRLGVVQAPLLAVQDAGIISSALVGFAAYYAVSSFILRTGRPWILPATSVSCAALYLLTAYLANGQVWLLWAGFAGCVALLAVISSVLAARFVRSDGINWTRITMTAGVGYLPVAVATLAAGFLV